MKGSLLCLLFLTFVCGVISQEGGDSTFEQRRFPILSPEGTFYFFEPFDEGWTSRWVVSENEKYNGEWNVEPPKTQIFDGDKGLVVGSVARHHAILALLDKPIAFHLDKPFIVQYEVQMQKVIECGGAYLKLISAETAIDPKDFKDDTPYSIMFGPDKCGSDSKVHFIFKHESPVTHEIEEKHMTERPLIPIDNFSHIYKLVVNPDNTFQIFIDEELHRDGSLLEDFDPPVNPPKEIDDPEDFKPADWVDEAEIPDPDDFKPDDWDETQPMMIPDPESVKPEDWLEDESEWIPDPSVQKPAEWDDDLDGDWYPPEIRNPVCFEHGCGKWEPDMIPNPLYKGKWYPRMIPNPLYKGPWKARQIPNPNYFEDLQPAKFKPIGAVGIEIWTMTNDILFDNILLTSDENVAKQLAEQWEFKYEQQEEKKASEAGNNIDSSLKSRLMQWLFIAYLYVNEYPIVFGTTLALGLLPILWCMCGSRRPTPSTPNVVEKETKSETGTEAASDSEIKSASQSKAKAERKMKSSKID